MTSQPQSLNINPQVECAETLASRFYTDPRILQIEKDRIFHRTWQWVGTLSQPCGNVNGTTRTIADPESFFTADVAGEPVVIVRDKEGILRAFSNVCRHRAGPIAQGKGCRHVFQCAYHGWTYTLDGQPDRHARSRRRRVFRSLHHGHGAAATRDLGAIFLRQFRRRRSRRFPYSSVIFRSLPKNFPSPICSWPSAAITTSIAIGRSTSTTTSMPTTFLSSIPA